MKRASIPPGKAISFSGQCFLRPSGRVRLTWIPPGASMVYRYFLLPQLGFQCSRLLALVETNADASDFLT
jgi:hypothetical protein